MLETLLLVLDRRFKVISHQFILVGGFRMFWKDIAASTLVSSTTMDFDALWSGIPGPLDINFSLDPDTIEEQELVRSWNPELPETLPYNHDGSCTATTASPNHQERFLNTQLEAVCFNFGQRAGATSTETFPDGIALQCGPNTVQQCGPEASSYDLNAAVPSFETMLTGNEISAVKSHIASLPGRNDLARSRVTRPRYTRPRISLEQGREESTIRGIETSSGGTVMTFGTSNHTRRRYGSAEGAATALTRKFHACQRCKKQKIRCGRNPDAPYQLCDGCSGSNPFRLKLPCFLASLTDARLFRPRATKGHPLEVSRKSVYALQDIGSTTEGVHHVRLTQGVGAALRVYVAEFVPQHDDKVVHVWRDSSGAKRSTEMPPYCIVGVDQAKENMLEYILQSRDQYIEHVKGTNGLTFTVFDEAQRFAVFNEGSTVRKALDLVAATRIIERDWYLLEPDTTRIEVVSEEGNPWNGKRPVTPMMDGQLDQLVIQGFLSPLRQSLLEELQHNISTARKEKWFEIFLTIFILLANAEQLLAHSRRNAIRHGADGRYNSPKLAEEYFHACKMMIAHFHFVCNYAMPLTVDWKSARARQIAKLDSEQAAFLTRIREKVRNEKTALLDLRTHYSFEVPSYWTHQIFFEDWKPGPVEMESYHINVAPAVYV